jgi:hypothetical protein
MLNPAGHSDPTGFIRSLRNHLATTGIEKKNRQIEQKPTPMKIRTGKITLTHRFLNGYTLRGNRITP